MGGQTFRITALILGLTLIFILNPGAQVFAADTEHDQLIGKVKVIKLSTLKIQIKIKIPKPVQIDFNANGGKAEYATKIVFTGLKYGKLPKATREDYTFTGWYTTLKGKTKINEDSLVKISKTKTYYAHWAKAQVNGPPVPSANILKVNINTAGPKDLQRITGVGPSIANNIISYRSTNGKFKTINELQNVKGIGAKTFEKMKDQITV